MTHMPANTTKNTMSLMEVMFIKNNMIFHNPDNTTKLNVYLYLIFHPSKHNLKFTAESLIKLEKTSSSYSDGCTTKQDSFYPGNFRVNPVFSVL